MKSHSLILAILFSTTIFGADLRDAVLEDDYDKCHSLIMREGMDVNHQNKDGNTALHAAVLEGRERIVELLLDNGANPNLTNKNGYAPLHNASFSKPIAKMLLDAQAETNPRAKPIGGRAGDTPAFVFYRHNKLALLKLLEEYAKQREEPDAISEISRVIDLYLHNDQLAQLERRAAAEGKHDLAINYFSKL